MNIRILIIMMIIKVSPFAYGNDDNALSKWTDPYYRNKMYPDKHYFVAVSEQEKVYRWQRADEEKKMTEELKRDLSQNIYINVRSEEHYSVSSFTHRDQSQHTERFSSEILIKSDIDLAGSEVKFHYDRRNRTLYGIIFIEKSVLADHYLEILQREGNVLKRQLINNAHAYTDAALTRKYIASYERSFERIITYSNIIIASGQSLPAHISSLTGRIRSQIDEVYQHLDHDYFSRKLRQANNQLLRGDNKAAYINFAELSLINPDNEIVRSGLSESKTKLENQYLANIQRYENNERYHDAIVKYDELFRLLPDIRNYHLKFYHELEQKAFDHYSQRLNTLLRNNNLDAMRMLIDKLSLYSHIDIDAYRRLKESVEQSMARSLFEQARIHYQNERYKRSISTISNALTLDNRARYRRLDKRARNKIYKQRLRSLKKTRPHKYALQIGAGLQNNMDMYDYYIANEDFNTTFISAYTAGLYRKFNISPDVRSNGRDRSEANIIGLKYSYINLKNPICPDNGIVSTQEHNLQELELVFGLTNRINLSFGVVVDDINKNALPPQFKYYTGTLSVRRCFLPLEFSFNIKGYVTPEMKIYPVLNLGTNININIKRQVNRHDRREIRYNVSNL